MDLRIKRGKTLKTVRFGKFFTIKEVEAIAPNGNKAHYFIREAPEFSIIIPFLNNDEVVMVRQYRMGADFISLEFPMGSVIGKDPVETAKTELVEETGYSPAELTYVGSFFPTSSSSPQKASVFTAKNLTKGHQLLEPTEVIEVVKVPFSEVGILIDKGVIMDGSTLAAFSLLQQSLR